MTFSEACQVLLLLLTASVGLAAVLLGLVAGLAVTPVALLGVPTGFFVLAWAMSALSRVA